MSQEQLENLLEKARANNAQNDITGLLVYSDGSIMQALEGPPDRIGKLISIISKDPRHKDFIIITDHETDQRDFPNWRMAYTHEPHPQPIENCINLLKFRDALHDEMSGKRIVGSAMSRFIAKAT